MWFEIIPSFGIIFVAMALPSMSAYYINKLVIGNNYRRSLLNGDQRRHYMRDTAFTGNPYKPRGLEAIPDN